MIEMVIAVAAIIAFTVIFLVLVALSFVLAAWPLLLVLLILWIVSRNDESVDGHT